MSEASVHATGVVPKEEKGYADSAALNERPDFDRSKIKQSVRKLAFAAIVTQSMVSSHGWSRRTAGLARSRCYNPFVHGWPRRARP